MLVSRGHHHDFDWGVGLMARICAAIAAGAVTGIALLAVAVFIASECFDARLIDTGLS